MNHDLLIKTTNRVAVYATIALIYWVFVFLTITVFDLKIFRERMTEMFFLSLLGIFAILGGAIILNVMSNLSKISSALSSTQPPEIESVRIVRWRLVLALISFPLIAAGLFTGNELSAQRKKNLLIASAEKLVSENQSALSLLANYKFSPEYLKDSERTLNVLNKIDKNFPEVMVIIPDIIDDKRLFLGFSGRRYSYNEKDKVEKPAYIYSTSREERDYLEKVFSGGDTAYRFHAEKGNYQLYFPATVGDRKLVLYFSDFQRYGKYGS
ncbi:MULTISPECIES: hypothetical protein [Methylobacter]